MKHAILTMALVAALVLSVCAPALAGDVPGPDKMKALVGKALVLDLAEKMDLAPTEVTLLMDEWQQYQSEMAEMKAERAAKKAALLDAIEAGKGDSEILGMLDEIVELDEEMFDLKVKLCEAYMVDLTGAQLAQAYLFLADYGKKVAQVVGGMGPARRAKPVAQAGKRAEKKAAVAEEAASPADQAIDVSKSWGAALAEQDLDTIMSYFAEDFEHYEYGDKLGIRDFIGQAIDMGYLEDLEVYTDDAEAEVDGEEVIVYPIELMGAFGAVTFELVFAEKDGEMKIVGMDASGI
ncbi:MAG: hypothetical protein ACLFTT_14130 [Candidatus Hydrogenedentota bacterium]